MRINYKSDLRYLFILAFGFLLLHTEIASAQSPKREMRASWLATVWRLDWPAVTVPANGSPAQREAAINQQKNELRTIFSRLQEANMNAVFFQVRSMSDVMYPSSYENWSSFISSERGADPGYDPLAFAIEEAHLRGLELHAWINPYRYSTSQATHGNLPDDYANSHPDWLMTYDGYTKILNPGKPEVTQRIVDIVAELVSGYDVDGIAFDDYFYINGGTQDYMDQAEYDAYNPEGMLRADWRRENCNRMIKSVYNKIQELKPWVTFGVSPAGVAASNADVAAKYGVPPAPVGNDWQYDGIYSDPLAWLDQGSIDYISPQIYWETNSANAYDKLAPWWSNVANKFGKHFYSSHSLTAMTGPAPAQQAIKAILFENEDIGWNVFSEIEKGAIHQKISDLNTQNQRMPAAVAYYFPELGSQVQWNRTSDMNGAPGSVFYATKKATGLSFVNYLKEEVFVYPALPPAIGWKKAAAQTLVEAISLSGNVLTWNYENNNVRYAIYAVPDSKINDDAVFSSSLYLKGIAYAKQFILPESISEATHKIAVSVLDHFGNEFSPRVMGESVTEPASPGLVYPANNESIVIPAIFKWNAVPHVDSYVWEVALDEGFNELFCSRETTETQFFSGLETSMKDNTDYYWRVRARVPNGGESYSEVRSFIGKKFKITSPVYGEEDVPIAPRIEWNGVTVSGPVDYMVEVATSSLFQSSQMVFSQTVQTPYCNIPDKTLTTSTTYFVRVRTSLNGAEAVTEVVRFTVEDLPIPVPVILSPKGGALISATEIEVVWEPQNSKGFHVELSENENFPPRSTNLKKVDAYSYSYIYAGLTPGVYYIRVSALTKDAKTAPSERVMVSLSDINRLDDIENKNEFCYNYRDRTGNNFVVIHSSQTGKTSIAIHSASGTLLNKTMHNIIGGQNTFPLDLAGYANGIYLIAIESDRLGKTLKIIK
ncbi:hypothetical protein MASR2M47_41670 [Draconibacterium sp.]|jgi:uncharacterized lipoprotein YddW (UPF0748 family)